LFSDNQKFPGEQPRLQLHGLENWNGGRSRRSCRLHQVGGDAPFPVSVGKRSLSRSKSPCSATLSLRVPEILETKHEECS
jgi:hypothetical protein